MISPKNKLRLRKWLLMVLRSIVWTADEWLHAAELRLQDDLACHAVAVKQSRAVRQPARSHDQHPDPVLTSGSVAGRRISSLPAVLRSAAKRELARNGEAAPARVSFLEWEARKSGVDVSARPRRRRAHHTAADFDRELREHFSQRPA